MQQAALEIKNLEKVYSGGHKALKGIDLRVEPGDFFALLGPNGAGKSTTIGVICSLVKKTAGNVTIFGLDIDKHFAEAKKSIGVVPQEFNFNAWEKVNNIILNQAGYYGIPRAKAKENTDKYLKQLGLWDKRNDPAMTLSGGMKRRLMIARALVHDPKLLILDEPTAGVDIELRRSMWSFLSEINQEGTTIILTTHYLEEAEQLCRNVAIINEGDIVENTSVKNLLKTLNREQFILDLQDPTDTCPSIEEFAISLVDEQTLEVEIEKGQSLNPLFDGLSRLGLSVVSMRNKANRLEELFVALIRSHNQESQNKEEG